MVLIFQLSIKNKNFALVQNVYEKGVRINIFLDYDNLYIYACLCGMQLPLPVKTVNKSIELKVLVRCFKEMDYVSL